MMHSMVKRGLVGISALCIVVMMSTGSADAGIFHHKKKQLSQKDDALASLASKQPDKELFDRAMRAMKQGHYDIARLDLQTLLNTYPESEYAMQAKLSIGDTWYKEGGAAAMQQAEEEYKDFITFFPNEPEAAEAQMKVADIYYKQMEKPDRDPTNALRAQDEYRAMILQYPDSSLIPQAKQKLREVQEVLGDHEFNIGTFYQAHMNYAASIARLQSLIDEYPLYSRTDLALIDVGNAYAAQANAVDLLRLPAEAKARLKKLYVRRAAAAYDRVILEYPMADHADEARDRLEAMGQPIPQPTEKQLAASAAVEQSRAPVNLKYRAFILITARPSVVQAAHVGEPSLVSPKPIMAPTLVQETMADIRWAAKPDGKPAPNIAATSNEVGVSAGTETAATSGATAPAATSASAASGTTSATPSLQMNDISGAVSGDSAPPAGADAAKAPTDSVQPPPGSASGSTTSPATSTPTGTNGQPTTWPSAREDNGGLPTIAPKDQAPLPSATKAAAAPDQINDVPAGGHSVNTADENASATGKKKKNAGPKFYGDQESSSKHKKKKGLHRLNPF